MPVIRFTPGPTVSAFMRSDARVKGIRGPLGSGKTTGALWEVMRRIEGQAPGPDGVRRSRWAIVRNSYRELSDTTKRSFYDWFPAEALGESSASENVQYIQRDGLEAEILFRSLDRPEDIRKLLSLELTGAYVNEAREMPLSVIQMLEGRIGRYPSARAGGPSWFGIIMDTNPPDAGHWWPEVFERERVAGWEQFVQPSGLSPEAENLENLPRGYYQNMIPGKTEEWINIYVHGRYGYLAEGKAVYPEFVASAHVSDKVKWNEGPVVVGLDFGLTPAAAIAQQPAGGGLEVLEEVVTVDTGAARFGEHLAGILRTRYGGKVGGIWGDPAGDIRAGTDEVTVYQVLAAKGVAAVPAPSQDPLLRREAVGGLMRRLSMSGRPALAIHPRCAVLVKGLAGFYHYRRLLVGGLEPRWQDKPDKNRYSHICEALEYLALGIGEGVEVLKAPQGKRRLRRAVGVI